MVYENNPGQSMTIRCDEELPHLYSGDFGLSRLSPNEYLLGSTYALDDEGIDVRESDVQTLTQRLVSHFSTAGLHPLLTTLACASLFLIVCPVSERA